MVHLSKEDLIAFETAVKQAWELGKVRCPVHLSGGNEDQLIEIFKEVKHGDYIFSTHRNHYHALLAGVDPTLIADEIFRKSTGLCGGASGSMCLASRSHNFYCSAIVGGICAIACGVALALKMSGSKHMVWCFVGDGCVDTGHFYEALRYAEGQDLPVTFVIEDNNRSTCTSIMDRWGAYRQDAVRGVHASRKVKGYTYVPTHPHVGSGKYVQF